MRTALLTLLLVAAPAFGQSVKLPAEVRGVRGGWIVIPVEVDGGPARYRFPDAGLEDVRLDALFPPELLAQMRGKVVKADRDGRYRLEAWNAKGDAASDIAVCVVVVGDVPPGPAPGPPGPTPPVPPTPVPPTPGPAPIPADGFRALFVVESADLGRLPRGQAAVLTAQSVRDYLNARCAKDANGWPGWRVWDQHVDPSAEAAHWKAAMARPRKSLPWLALSNGKTGWEGPLPATVEETLKLLQQFGG